MTFALHIRLRNSALHGKVLSGHIRRSLSSEFATSDSPVVQSRKYLEDYGKAKESGQPLSNDRMRIALEAKRQPGPSVDGSDYADLQTKETKLRELIKMKNYSESFKTASGQN